MCTCPNGPKGHITIVAVFSLTGLACTLFSFIWVLVFGLIATIYTLLLLFKEMESGALLCGTLLCWLVAVLQIVTAVILDESHLSFCDSSNVDQQSALCNVVLYQTLNAVGAFVWIIDGIFVIALPDPEPRNIHRPSTVACVQDSSKENTTIERVTHADGSITVKVTHPDESVTVSETGAEGKFEEGCNV